MKQQISVTIIHTIMAFWKVNNGKYLNLNLRSRNLFFVIFCIPYPLSSSLYVRHRRDQFEEITLIHAFTLSTMIAALLIEMLLWAVLQ
jgi:hypothetical protein